MPPSNLRFSPLVDHLTTEVMSSMEQFEQLKDEWKGLFNTCNDLSVFQTFTWNYVWWKYYGKAFRLWIVTVRENGRLVGIAPLTVRSRLGVSEIEPICGEHHYSFALIMESSRDDVAAAIALKVLECFPTGLVHIPYFSAGTKSVDVFMAVLNSEGWRDTRWTRNISHYVSEANGFNQYMAQKSRKSRYNLKRERSRLDEADPVGLRHIGMHELTGDIIERIAHLQKKSWLARRGQESVASPFYQEVLPALAKENNAEIFLYEQTGEDLAYVLNLYSGHICYCLFIGFDATKATSSPGKMLMMDTLHHVLDHGITVYDFLYGEGEYKRFWANRTAYVCRAVACKGFLASLASWFPHRLHGTFARYHQLKKAVVKMRRLKAKVF